MKTFVSAIIFVFLNSFALAGEKRVVTLSVPGMTCPSCASSIERELKKLDGISDIEISIGSRSVVVTMAESSKILNSHLDSAIKAAGFEVKR